MAGTKTGVELESMECQDSSGTYRAEYDIGKAAPSIAVVAATDVDPMNPEPLQRTIDTEAPDSFIRSMVGSDEGVHLFFIYEGHTTTVTGDGVVTDSTSGRGSKSVATEAGIQG